MQGANELYNLFHFVGEINNNPCELKKIGKIAGYCNYAYQYQNIVFLLDEHARGKTFHIWIYGNIKINDYLNDDHLEVYGVTGGQRGWTETYGWVKQGNWVDYIEKYFVSLRLYKEQIIHEQNCIDADSAKEQAKLEKEKTERYNNMFPNNNRNKVL